MCVYLAENGVECFIEPSIRAQMSGTSAMKNVMKYVRVISIIDPSILFLQRIVERRW